MLNAVIVGTGDYTYDALTAWQQLPAGVNLIETPGVAVGVRDRVYALTRNPAHPVMVFEPDGTFVASFGQGVFSERTHGILAGPDGSIYCADDGTHTITKFTPDGQLLMTMVTAISQRRAGAANRSTVQRTWRCRP